MIIKVSNKKILKIFGWVEPSPVIQIQTKRRVRTTVKKYYPKDRRYIAHYRPQPKITFLKKTIPEKPPLEGQATIRLWLWWFVETNIKNKWVKNIFYNILYYRLWLKK